MDALTHAWRWRQLRRPVLLGGLGMVALLTFYLGTITLAQDPRHAWQQLLEDRWFVGALTLGLGLQLTLWDVLRQLQRPALTRGVVASTGTSTVAMLACCAHHLVEVLPILGLAGAAVVLGAYKTPLLWLGVVFNAGSVLMLSRAVWRQLDARRTAGASI